MVCKQCPLAVGLLPWQTRLKLFFLTLLLYAVRRRDGTLNRLMLSLLELKTRANPSVMRGVRTADFTVDPARGVGFRLFLPAGVLAAARLPALIFFHGGGFAFLSSASRQYDALCRSFCKELGVAVLSVNYRLAPEHRFPAQYDDGVDILRFLECARASSFYGEGLLREFVRTADLSLCFLGGDSAGANIAHHVARRWTSQPSRHVHLAGLIAIQPFFGGEGRVLSETRLAQGPLVTTERTDWAWKMFLPDGAARDHPAASATVAAESLSESFPPVLVMAGELDPLLDWQRTYFRSLLAKGKEARLIEYSGAIHAFYLFPELEGSPVLIEDIRSFILRQTSRRRRVGHLRATAQRVKVSAGSSIASGK